MRLDGHAKARLLAAVRTHRRVDDRRWLSLELGGHYDETNWRTANVLHWNTGCEPPGFPTWPLPADTPLAEVAHSYRLLRWRWRQRERFVHFAEWGRAIRLPVTGKGSYPVTICGGPSGMIALVCYARFRGVPAHTCFPVMNVDGEVLEVFQTASELRDGFWNVIVQEEGRLQRRGEAYCRVWMRARGELIPTTPLPIVADWLEERDDCEGRALGECLRRQVERDQGLHLPEFVLDDCRQTFEWGLEHIHQPPDEVALFKRREQPSRSPGGY